MMNKRAVIADLHLMIDTRLFGSRPWLADREACDAIRRKLDGLGLQERLPGDPETTRFTSLGKELNLDLILAFVGLWFEWEIPSILEEYGLIDEIDELRLYDQLDSSDDPEHVLRPLVRKAFFDHYNPSDLLN